MHSQNKIIRLVWHITEMFKVCMCILSILNSLIPPKTLLFPLHPDKARVTHLFVSRWSQPTHQYLGYGTATVRVGGMGRDVALGVWTVPTQVVGGGAAAVT